MTSCPTQSDILLDTNSSSGLMDDDDNMIHGKNGPNHYQSTQPLGLVRSMLKECFLAPCGPIATAADTKGLNSSAQFLELHGIEFIGLGALIDELTARERVYDTLEQLTSRTERLISIGYLVDDERAFGSKSTETVSLDIWTETYPNDRTMSAPIKRTIQHLKSKQFDQALCDLQKTYQTQYQHKDKDNNNFMLGITAHNMGVVSILAGKDDLALPLFEEAIELKRESFGDSHPEVAVSLDELGIQLFANERYEEALSAFNETRKILSKWYGFSHPRLCMLLNNIACCYFQMGNSVSALLTLGEARQLQHERNENSAAKGDLDLLHMAILLNNFGYLKVNMKQYDEAQACFEEALLIQQSVLGDAHNHRAIHDSRSNLEFTNAFHSQD